MIKGKKDAPRNPETPDPCLLTPAPYLPPFPLLADPASYVACEWELISNDAQRDYWISVFRNHFPRLLDEAASDGWAGSAAAAIARFGNWLDQAPSLPRLTILDCCIERENVLREVGIDDAFKQSKDLENDRALKVLPDLLKQLDEMDEPARSTALIQGIFAGNIFDLGAVETADLFDNGATIDFHQVRDQLKPRPWLFDGLDEWVSKVSRESGKTNESHPLAPSYHCACMFVDNAGPDIVLGMIPFARDLLKNGTRVLLAANDAPTLNDITVSELHALLKVVASFDDIIKNALADGQLEIVGSGNSYPLIDLAAVSQELVDAVMRLKPDLLVLEGMGRAVESNLYAKFTCDTLKLAMVKDAGVARMLGGSMYDLVMRFEPT